MTSDRSRSRSPSFRRRPEGRGGDEGGRRDFQQRSYDRKPMRRDRSPAKPSRVLGVFGLAYATSEDTLRKIFEEFGAIERLVILTDKITNNSRGFGFITYDTIDIATEAKDKCNGMEIDGRSIRVDFSTSDKPKERRDFEGGERRSFERRPQYNNDRHGGEGRRDDRRRNDY